MHFVGMSHLQATPLYNLDPVPPDLFCESTPVRKSTHGSPSKVHAPFRAQAYLMHVFLASTEANSLLTASCNMPLLPSLLPP